MKKLLTTAGNPKTDKGTKYGYLTAVLHLSPYKASGQNVCPMAELANCWQGCLNTAGRGGIAKDNATQEHNGYVLPDNVIQSARLARTKFLQDNWGQFFVQLVKEITAHVRKARKNKLIPCVRLNGTSDLRWESMRHEGKTIFDVFPDVQFYDYTKIPNRKVRHANYHLSLSYSEANADYAQLITDSARMQGRNLVVVFRNELPDTFAGMPVVDGDDSDLRFLDPAGVVVGLKAKGKAKKDTSGFVV